MEKTIGQVICELRKKKNITQNNLARQVDVTQTYLSLIENGIKKPSLSLLMNIAVALKMELSEMIIVRLPSDNYFSRKERNKFETVFSKLIESIAT